ncbi:carbamoyl-phosphate synthase large subunit [Actinomyces sp. F1_1611]
MPKREDIQSVLVIGSGPIVIGQAAEFDYSGTQACRILREEGLRVILVNSNPATIMTDPEFADATYIEPITPDMVERIIAKERPDALLPTLGGQTALNTAVALSESGVLDRYGVELIGVQVEAIQAGEDRQLFKDAVEACGAEVCRSFIAHSMDDCLSAAEALGYPLVVRPSFTMGGLGSGMAFNEDQLRRIAGAGLQDSPTHEVLLEESILGWKEIELEMIRDLADNIVTVCSIENVDPVGVHTGDSITVAPAMTLTEAEYQNICQIGADLIRQVGVRSSGCNIQFAIHPENGRVIVIEMNPRVSRSSALASKATGYPIAKIAARLAIGYLLTEIPNEFAPNLTAADGPQIDYVAVKVPRFAFEKFTAGDTTLTTTMKSVGEAMALGRNFMEALNKAFRSIDKPGVGFSWSEPVPTAAQVADLLQAVQTPTEERLNQIQQAIRGGATLEQLNEATDIDPWFLDQFFLLEEVAQELAGSAHLDASLLRRAKEIGFSDQQIAQIRGLSEETVREVRHAYDLRPVYKTVDTCAGLSESNSSYYYSAYDTQTEVAPRTRPAVMILGSGPNRIGQGIEFDYSCVHAALTLKGQYETIMVNCNPETVSTDYDTADRLYFEPITFEDVLEIYQAESQVGPVVGVIVQLGGQTPLKLARELEAAGLPIWGTSPSAIDLAEDRGQFGQVLLDGGLAAPAFGSASGLRQALQVADTVGYPVLVRPSYVLGGRGMEIVYSPDQLTDYVRRTVPGAAQSIADRGQARFPSPVLIDHFLDEAVEIDVDALFDGTDLFVGGIMEHIEEAGIHSGDSSCILPPVTISSQMITQIREATRRIAEGVGVRGLLNVQFAISSDVLYVLEANPRASRTVPFVAKATGVPLAQAAALIMSGRSVAELKQTGVLPQADPTEGSWTGPLAVKEAVLPFKRFRRPDGRVVDNILGPEMLSTGEVMGLDANLPMAFAKSQAAAYGGLPTGGTVFVSVADRHKRSIVFPVERLHDLGFEILATRGTAEVLRRYAIPVREVARLSESGPDSELDNIVKLIVDGQVDMVVNTPTGQEDSRSDGYAIRSATTSADRPIVTTIQQFGLAVLAIEAVQKGNFTVESLQEYEQQRALPSRES